MRSKILLILKQENSLHDKVPYYLVPFFTLRSVNLKNKYAFYVRIIIHLAITEKIKREQEVSKAEFPLRGLIFG